MNYSNTSMYHDDSVDKDYVFNIIRSCTSKDVLNYLNRIIESAIAQRDIITKYNKGDMIGNGR